MSEAAFAPGGIIPLEAGAHEFAETESREEMFVSGKPSQKGRWVA